METVVLEKSGVITDMKSRVKDVMMAISWRDFANTYFHKSSSWFYHKMDGIDGNGGTGGISSFIPSLSTKAADSRRTKS